VRPPSGGDEDIVAVRAHLERIAPSIPAGGWRSFLRRAFRSVYRALADAFSQNNLLTYASAIAFQVLIALVALVLFGLALIDVLGLQEIYTDNVSPSLESRLLIETFVAIETTVQKIFQTGSLLLLLFALLLAIWEVSGSVRGISGALNDIYGCEETRSIVRRFAISFALAIAVIVSIVGAVFTANLLPRIGGIPTALGQLVGWVTAIVLLGCAVWLLLRYAPVRTRSAGWSSVGTIFIIVSWVVASLLYGLYVQNVANYETATGNLVALLTLTGYLYTSSIIFLTGAQIDELLRKQADRGRTGLVALTSLDDHGRGGSNGTGQGPKSGRARSGSA
jgi:membrane protein